MQLLLAATAAKVFVPGYIAPMSSDEHLQALHRQVQYLREQLRYLNEQHCAAAIHAQYWADRCFTAETANAAETARATNSPVPANANEPSREEHTRSQPTATAKSNSSTTYAQAVMSSDTPLSPVVKRTARTKPNGRDCPANAARTSAAAGPEPAVTRSPTELRYNPADNAAAAALWTAAAAECDDPRILRAVLLAAAATANALAQTGDSAGTPTRRKATPDSEGGSQNPAPPKPEAHRHTSAKGHCRQPHNQAVSGSPT